MQVIVRLKAEMVLWTFKPKLSLEINRGKINTYECLHVEQVLSTPVLRNLSYWKLRYPQPYLKQRNSSARTSH